MYFTELGLGIKEAWCDEGFRKDRLAKIAARELAENLPHAHLGFLDVIAWAESASVLPQQARLDEAFGQPPLTVFWDDRFRIDVLFWHTATTGIHQHKFWGAFTLLEGSSLHSRYQFSPEKELGPGLRLGKLTLNDVELLKAGDVREINCGSDLIHSLFHLDNPSVSIVVRTPDNPDGGPEFEYKPPTLAIDPAHFNQATTKKSQLLRLLMRLKSPEYERLAAVALKNSDLHLAFIVLRQALVHHESPDMFDRLLKEARARHGHEIELLLPSLHEEWRRAFIISQRKQVTNPDQRFFLALLMNLPCQDAISKIISVRHKDSEPLDLIQRWCVDLSGLDKIGIEFDETIRLLFRYLLQNKSMDEIVQLLSDEYDADTVRNQRDLIKQACERIRASEVLRPLFQ